MASGCPEVPVNFAFINSLLTRDTIFTTEYLIRTGMESVHTLMDVDRGTRSLGSQYHNLLCSDNENAW